MKRYRPVSGICLGCIVGNTIWRNNVDVFPRHQCGNGNTSSWCHRQQFFLTPTTGTQVISKRLVSEYGCRPSERGPQHRRQPVEWMSITAVDVDRLSVANPKTRKMWATSSARCRNERNAHLPPVISVPAEHDAGVANTVEAKPREPITLALAASPRGPQNSETGASRMVKRLCVVSSTARAWVMA